MPVTFLFVVSILALGTFTWGISGIWCMRIRKVTMITNTWSALFEDDEHEVVRCRGFVVDDKVIPRAKDREKTRGLFSLPLSSEGITWCWGWKQEDVDALVVANVLR